MVPGPTAAFTTASPEIDFVTGGIDFINNSQNYTGSLWQFGDGGSSTLDNPSYFYPASTIADYNVMLVVYDANGCSDTAYNVVQSTDVVRLTVPNAFTPNGDGLNDTFEPKMSNIETYKIMIFNRWGELIFTSNDPSNQWDGTVNSNEVQIDVYVYKIVVTGFYQIGNLDSEQLVGTVTVIR